MNLFKSILIVSLIIICLSIGGIALFWLADVIPVLKAIIPLVAFIIAVFQIFDSTREYKNQ